MNGKDSFIELDRRFIELDRSDGGDVLATSSYLHSPPGSMDPVGWNQLLGKRLVVILGEPGSGKSRELRHRASLICEAGQFSALIELEQLVGEPLQQVLSEESFSAFQAWKHGDQVGYFFLDSVDEAKLRRQTDFHRAIQRLRDAIEAPSLERARFIISSRVSEWRPETDWREVQSRLGTDARPRETSPAQETRGEELNERDLAVFRIQPLNSSQVRLLAAAHGVTNVDAFATAIDENFAWDFAGRPLDVQELASYWKTNGRLGTLSEIIEADVQRKLHERVERLNSYSLSEDKVRLGATTLAAATLMCRQISIVVPDNINDAAEGLNPAGCLPSNWTAEQVNSLLNRAIFDGESYGRVRFHHRRIAEYLAAEWFTLRMQEGCPRPVLDQIFFERQGAARVLRPSLTPVAAWLCVGTEPWNDDFRSWILTSAPEIHLEYGDPAALPLEYRRQILAAWVKKNEGRERTWNSSTPDALGRFAAAELGPDIAELIKEKSTPSEIREELALLIRFGRLTQAVPILLEIIRDPDEQEELKRYAVSAIRDIAETQARQELWAIAQSWTKISAGLCGDVIEAVFPQAMGPAELAALLKKVVGDDGEVDSLTWVVGRHFDTCLEAKDTGALASSLTRLVTEEQIHWILDLLPKVLNRLLKSSLLDNEQRDVATDSLLAITEHPDHFWRDDECFRYLDTATKEHPAIRRAVFWKLVDDDDSLATGHIPWRACDGRNPIHFSSDDTGWLLQDIQTQKDAAARRLALTAAIQFSGWPLKRKGYNRLKAVVGNDDQLSAILNKYQASGRGGWLGKIRGGRYREPWWYRVGEFRRRLSARLSRLRTQWRLWWHRRRLREGSAVGWLIDLLWEARDERHVRWSPESWKRMRSLRGKGVTDAVKAGCQVAWRKLKLDLPHENPDLNKGDSAVIVGLAALEALASRDPRFKVLSDEDAKLATRYAVNELNGFPDWLVKLAQAHEAAVREVLNECVSGEWKYAAERPHAYDVLADLAHEAGTLANLTRTHVIDLLRAGDPDNVDVLTFALMLLLRTEAAPSELATIALDRCKSLDLNDRRFIWWSAVGLQLDALSCLAVLEGRLIAPTVTEKVLTGIAGLLESRGRERLPQIRRPSFVTPRSLERLIPFVYRHIRPSDDIERAGKGAYSPTERDSAQDFRNSLLPRLAQSQHRDADAVLGALLNNSTMLDERDWIKHLIDDRRRRVAEDTPWEPRDVRAFAVEFETFPKTSAELYRIGVNRLIDIKHLVEQSDNSLREEVPAGADEYVLRRWLARKLTERSRQRYTVPQEEELDQEKRPDLRLHNPVTAPVGIEVKWAERWTLPQLLDRLESQLVGQYLRAHDARHGIYLLAIDGRKGGWKDPNGKLLTFGQVAEIIRARAFELESDTDGVDALSVVTIDFRDPAND